MKHFPCIFLVLLCVVDQVTNETVIAEVSESTGSTKITEIPKLVIPCELSEGDMFHIVNIEGVVEVRCGEPDPS